MARQHRAQNKTKLNRTEVASHTVKDLVWSHCSTHTFQTNSPASTCQRRFFWSVYNSCENDCEWGFVKGLQWFTQKPRVPVYGLISNSIKFIITWTCRGWFSVNNLLYRLTSEDYSAEVLQTKRSKWGQICHFFRWAVPLTWFLGTKLKFFVYFSHWVCLS